MSIYVYIYIYLYSILDESFKEIEIELNKFSGLRSFK